MVEKDNQFNNGLCAFLDASPSPFHAVASMISMLEQAGFSALDEADDWQLVSGSKHYVAVSYTHLRAHET